MADTTTPAAAAREGGKRPTKAQREVLGLMAEGHRLMWVSDYDAWIASPCGGRQLHRWTAPSLLRHDWIKAIDDMGNYWTITDLGRAALTALSGQD